MKRFVKIMKRLLVTVSMLLCMNSVTLAGDWNVNFMGISYEQVKQRDWKAIVAGAVSSIIVHEASHLLFAEANGGGYTYINHSGMVTKMQDYYNRSHSTQQMFHRSGFLGQLLVGGVLTAIPSTRHADFTVGFNGASMVHIGQYTLINNDGKYSDVGHLDNGEFEGGLYTVGAGVLTVINLQDLEE